MNCIHSRYDVYNVVVLFVVAMKEKGADWILNIASLSPRLHIPVLLLTLHPSEASGAGASHASWYLLWFLSGHDTHADMITDVVCFLHVFESSMFCKYDCIIHCMLHDDLY